jgi:glycosyltransferase involved in cell wall biosynthesis
VKISVVIPTLNAASTLGETLAALGSVDEIIVVDGSSDDRTVAIAEQAGARVGSCGHLTEGKGAATRRRCRRDIR